MDKRSLRYPDIFRNVVLEQVEPLLARLQPDGFFRPLDPRANKFGDSQAILPLTYFYKTQFAGNPYFGDRRVRDAIYSIGDAVASATDTDGHVHCRFYGHIMKIIDQRFASTFIDSYTLLKDELDAKRRRNWETCLRRTVGALAHLVESYLPQERFTHCRSSPAPTMPCCTPWSWAWAVCCLIIKRG